MNDLEMVRLCADAMGYTITGTHHGGLPVMTKEQGLYDPIHDDAQTMALGKAHPELFEAAVVEWASIIRCGERPDLNHILCKMVADELPTRQS